VRANAVTFLGAFLLALIYSTKPDGGTSITLARSGDTSLVVDTSDTDGRNSAADSSVAASTATEVQTGSESPPVAPADLETLKSEGLIVPVAGVAAKDLVDSFDEPRDGTRHHNAIDIPAPRNTPVLAAAPGDVLKLHDSEAGGLTIYVSDSSSRFVMMYGHLERFQRGLKEGRPVKRGETIGFVGSTGNANPLAPHLHFQITRNDDLKQWWKGTPVNPFPVFRPRG
jgi:murein DD-endopeptidase MepM/ murein hydrolase activator NlpD